MSDASRAVWKCDDCNQEIGSTHSRSDGEDTSVIVDLLKSLRSEVAASKNFNSEKFGKIEEAINTVNLSLEDFKNKITCIEVDIVNIKAECNHLKQENNKLSQRVWDLEANVSDLQQYIRVNNVEIRGIPLTRGEDVYSVLQSIARAIGVPYRREDFSIAHRLPAPRNKRFHPSIVVQFVSRTTRGLWLAAAKENKLKTTDLVPSFAPAPVFIGDHLTPYNRMVLGRAKALAKQGKLAYAWSKDGKIFIRKTSDSPAIKVRTTADVEIEATGAVLTTQTDDVSAAASVAAVT